MESLAGQVQAKILTMQSIFKGTAEEFQRMARDVTKTEVAQALANSQAQFNSELSQQRAITARTAERLQESASNLNATRQAAQAQVHETQQQAQQALNDQRNQLLQAAASQAAEARHQAIESTKIEADHNAQIEIRKAHEAATAQAQAEHAIRIQEYQE